MKISGYMTTRNAAQMGYPFIETLKSLDAVVDEIVVCDSSDGQDDTSLKLTEFATDAKASVLQIRPDDIDWSAPNHGIYDGITKGKARAACTGDYLIQMDADEILVTTREQLEYTIHAAFDDNDTELFNLPVVEYWGSEGKVRVDVNPWKWRISKNVPHITHGIPGSARKFENGLMYAHHGTDGCDYIHTENLSVIPPLGFMSPQVELVRRQAVTDAGQAQVYEQWFNKKVKRLPTIFHFSWWSVYQKMLKYKLFWNDSWISLYNEQRPAGYNPFFNKPFSEVSDQEMIDTARKLEKETGGHIFHKPWDGSKTNHVIIKQDIPEVIKPWCEQYKTP